MRYIIKTKDLANKVTTFQANKISNEKSQITFYYDDEIVCVIKKIIE